MRKNNTFVDGNAGVTQLDREQGISRRLIDRSSTRNACNTNYVLLIYLGQIYRGYNPNDILNPTMRINNNGVMLFNIDQSGCSDEFHMFAYY